MTHSKFPTSRAEIATGLAHGLQVAAGDPEVLRSALYLADRHLHRLNLAADRHWLCEHIGHIRLADAEGLAALTARLIERLTIEGDQPARGDLTGRTLDALTADAKRHLAVSGNRRDFAAGLVAHNSGQTIEEHLEQLALLLTDALLRLSGYDAVIDELHQLRAQVEIEQAKAEQPFAQTSYCPKCFGQNGHHGLVHIRNEQGSGGSNVRCPLASAEAVQA